MFEWYLLALLYIGIGLDLIYILFLHFLGHSRIIVAVAIVSVAAPVVVQCCRHTYDGWMQQESFDAVLIGLSIENMTEILTLCLPLCQFVCMCVYISVWVFVYLSACACEYLATCSFHYNVNVHFRNWIVRHGWDGFLQMNNENEKCGYFNEPIHVKLFEARLLIEPERRKIKA